MFAGLIQVIADFVGDVKTAHRLIVLTRSTHRELKIRHITTIMRGLTETILRQPRYRALESLNVTGNFNICDVSYLPRLHTLYAQHSSGLTNESLKKLNLRRLYIGGNNDLTQFQHMTNLTVLDCRRTKLDDLAIASNANIEELYASNCPSIRTITHLYNLRILYCSWNSGIVGEQLKSHNLHVLYCSDNPAITKQSVAHMDRLQLHIADNSSVRSHKRRRAMIYSPSSQRETPSSIKRNIVQNNQPDHDSEEQASYRLIRSFARQC